MEGLSGLSQATLDLLRKRTKPDLESKAQRRARVQLHKKLRGAIPGVFNVMQETP